MADQGTLKERLQRAASSSADRLAALEATEQGTADTAGVVTPKPAPVEKRGVGKPAFDSVAAAKIAQLKAKIKALVGKPDLQAKIAAQIKAIQDAK